MALSEALRGNPKTPSWRPADAGKPRDVFSFLFTSNRHLFSHSCVGYNAETKPDLLPPEASLLGLQMAQEAFSFFFTEDHQ